MKYVKFKNMSRSVVIREQAEEYAMEHNVTLMEAKEILLDLEQTRIRTKEGYRIKTDQDGFYIGTEPNENLKLSMKQIHLIRSERPDVTCINLGL